MKEFYELLQLVGDAVPDLVSLLACPVLLLVVGLLLAVFHKKRAYLPLAVGLGGVAAFLVSCEADGWSAFVAYLSAYTVFAVLVSLLLLIPCPVRGKEKDRTEEMYEKFHLPLEVPLPAEEPQESGAEGSVRLEHALSLVEQLKKSDLSATDRLEADALERKLESCRGRALGEEETRQINDCLATVLKMTAKYKL